MTRSPGSVFALIQLRMSVPSTRSAGAMNRGELSSDDAVTKSRIAWRTGPSVPKIMGRVLSVDPKECDDRSCAMIVCPVIGGRRQEDHRKPLPMGGRQEAPRRTFGRGSCRHRTGPRPGQLIYDLRTATGLSQRELAERMATTQSVISRLEEGGGARNRIDTLARVAVALDRHLVLSFPSAVPADLTDAIQIA
ncbi:MAG: XRE family transcriptional regulator [Acidimicrobiia bacterium]|nr:XRE family transcriptional regulator [Acidimicrobiia bacterium]